MTWDEIKVQLDQVVSGSALIDGLLNRDEFWKSEERFVFRAASYLYEHEKPSESLRIIDAVKLRGFLLSPKAEMGLRYLRGDALHSMKKYSDAVAVYREILAVELSDVAHGNRALAYWEMGSFQEALNDYLEAVKLNPLNTVALRGAGEMLNELDRSSDAVRYLSAAVKLDPKYSAAFTALGVAYYNSKEWLKSYQALKKAVELDPEDKIAAMGIAKIEAHFELEKLALTRRRSRCE